MSGSGFSLPGIGWLDNASGKGAVVGQCGDTIGVLLRIETEAIADYYRRASLSGSTTSDE